MNNEELKNIATKIIDQLPKKPDRFGYVVTILMVISIILTLIRVIQECHKNKIKTFGATEKCSFFKEEIKTLSFNRSWFTRMTIKKIIRKELSKDDYYEYGNDLMKAILNTGEYLNEKEVNALMEAINV